MELNTLTIKQAGQMLAKKEISSVDLTKACLARIKEVDGKIKACLTVCENEALTQAKTADARRSKGEQGELLGIPMLVKDVIMTKEVRTTAASRILDNYTAPYDATVVRRLKAAGAVLLGKTNTDEFAHGSSTENSAYWTSRNPWDLTRVPGGSSGGSAAGVAADMSIFALGTDTGGSTRYPAAFCGIVGLKQTYGRSSRFGLMAMTSSTDVPGIFGKTVADVALVLNKMAGVDKNDATTVNDLVPDYGKELSKSLKGLTIGLPAEYFIKGIHQGVIKAINQAMETFKNLGVKFKPVSLPLTKYALPVYYIICPAEISSNLARFDGIGYGFSEQNGVKNLYETYAKSRGKGFGLEAKRRIMLGTYALSAGYYDAYYLKAQKVRSKLRQEMYQALEEVDCLLTPTAPHPAFKIGQQVDDPLKMYLEDIFMVAPSLAGLPGLSVPCGFAVPDDGETPLPVGLQLIGKRLDETTILRVGHQYEQATEWHKQKAKI
ncbi:MAG: Asp-tRNA(Asn)/Glu-tRNA(Gln) amidotransferase subunit GatA [Parcubacteria group bacterium]|nr:Asp-tRNA(Asn)/Glu-tRNA(Gln) amidotransferase subunit GatA [Parcubacteria group bacterium]